MVQPTLDQTVLLNFRSLERDGVLIVDELIQLFLFHTQPLLETIERTSVEPSTNTFRIALHRLKGSSASIGAVRLSHLCEELEHQSASGTQYVMRDFLVQIVREYEHLREELEHFSHP